MKANQHLKSARIMRGWSQAKVAEAVGTDPVTVSRWERGLSFPYPSFREKLCLLFGKNAQELGLVQSFSSASSLSPVRALYDPLLPRPLTGATKLVGRDALLSQLKHLLRGNERTNGLALHGLPGVGKTSLAIALAYDHDIREHFSDGILWVGLGPHPILLDHLSRWGALLETAPSEASPLLGLKAWAEALRTVLGPRRMLLVIDDAWTLEATLALAVGGPHCTTVVTTRFPQLALQFAPTPPVLVQELSENESMALVSQWEPEVALHEQQEMRTLVQLVGGLPLALTLIGKYLREQTSTHQDGWTHTAVKRLHNAASRLHLTEAQSVVKQHSDLQPAPSLSLQSVILVSDQRLNTQSQIALRMLSVFPPKPNTFSEGAACAVCALPVEVLDVLVDAGLLESNGGGRYTLHQTICDYATLHYKEQGASERLVAYFKSLIEAHATDYTTLGVESTNILAALEVAYTQEMQKAFISMVCSIAPFWHVRASYLLAEGYLLRAYQVAKNSEDVHGQACILQHLAHVHEQWGNYETATTHARKSLALAHFLSDKTLQGVLLASLGRLMSEQGNYIFAEVYSLEGLQVARENGDAGLQSSLLLNLGYVADMRGDYMQEEAYYQEGLELARRVGDPNLIGSLLINLGDLKREQGEYQQAELYLHEGLHISQQMGHKSKIIFFLTNFGELEYERGNYTSAETYLQDGLTLARHIGHRENCVSLLVPLAMVARDQGNFARAETYLQEGLNIARQTGHREWRSSVLRTIGSVALLQGEKERAKVSLQEALLLARQIQHNVLIGATLLHLGILAIYQGEYQQAEAYLQEGLLLAQQARKIWLICSLLFCLGKVYLLEQRIDLASTTFNQMLITVPQKNRDLTPKALYGLALVAFARGDIRTARSLGTTSYKTFDAIGHYLAHDVEQWLHTLPTT